MVLAFKPESEYAIALTPTLPICDHGPADDKPRSMVNPDSFPELSCQPRLIWVEETPEAARFDGAVGAVGLSA